MVITQAVQGYALKEEYWKRLGLMGHPDQRKEYKIWKAERVKQEYKKLPII